MTLDERLLAAARRFRDRPAITVAGVRASYEELFLSAIDVRERLRLCGLQPGQLVALCAERTFAAYSSVLGILLAGCGYVPLNVAFPASRNRQILSSSQAVALVVDDNVQAELEKHVGVAPLTLPILQAMPVPRSGVPGAELDDFKSLGALAGQTVAYLLFTSGTTGVPKGVPINAGNLKAYIDAVHALMPIDSSDRLLQAVDLTFDLSVHDMMMCWLHGAELFVAPQNGAILAPRIIRANNLTACLLVPSAAAKSAEFGLIAPDAMPSLKYSLFAGEAFPVSLSRKWQAAAPNATIFNMYGPTEGTIHTSFYRVDPKDFFDGSVTPIGWPIGKQRLSIRNGDGAEVARGETGEIWLSGPQMTAGYWHAPVLDAEKFVSDGSGRWYRTGDAGRLDARHGVIFAGRLDRQIKIRGYRVELQDVEAALASASQSEQVAAVAWPRSDEGSAEAIIGFVAAPKVNIGKIRERLHHLLPPYMLPAEIQLIEDLPLNVNGKIDYRHLEQRLAER